MSAAIKPFGDEFEEYGRDESRTSGEASSISFPTTEDEVRAILRKLHAEHVPITVQGARTGLAAGAVPHGGHILNTSRMNRYLGLRRDEQGRFLLRVESGVVLSELRKQLGKKALPTAGWDQASLEAYEEFQAAPEQFFPTDPTEASACLGGMAACNASGARSYAYGPMRPHVTGLHVALADGDLLELHRGQAHADARHLSLVTAEGRALELDLPGYTMPKTKNASGYFVSDDMDAIDLFIGACGTLGVITELEIALQAAPSVVWGVSCFFDSEDKAVSFTDSVRPVLSHAAAIEYFDAGALDILRRQREQSTAFASLPALDKETKVCVYVELDCDDEVQATEELYHLGWVLEPRAAATMRHGSRAPRLIASASGSSAMRSPRASTCLSTSVAAPTPALPSWGRICRCPTRAWPMSLLSIAARWPKAGLSLPPGDISATTICM